MYKSTSKTIRKLIVKSIGHHVYTKDETRSSSQKLLARRMADEVERTKSSVGNRIVGASARERCLRRRLDTERSKSVRTNDLR